MKSFAVATTLSTLASMAAASSAPLVSNNPIGASYTAQIKGGESDVTHGYVSMTSNPGGVGMKLSVNIAGLPILKGPYTYYVGDHSLSSECECSTSGGIFDPYNAGKRYCNRQQAQTCDVGDLSGKHGCINSTSYVASYNELYASLNSASPAYVGGKSIVISDRSGSPVACGNIVCVSEGNPYGSPYGNGTAPYPTNGTAPYPTNGTTGGPYTTTKPPGLPTNTPIKPTSTPSSRPSPPEGSAATLAISSCAALVAVVALLNLV